MNAGALEREMRRGPGQRRNRRNRFVTPRRSLLLSLSPTRCYRSQRQEGIARRTTAVPRGRRWKAALPKVRRQLTVRAHKIDYHCCSSNVPHSVTGRANIEVSPSRPQDRRSQPLYARASSTQSVRGSGRIDPWSCNCECAVTPRIWPALWGWALVRHWPGSP